MASSQFCLNHWYNLFCIVIDVHMYSTPVPVLVPADADRDAHEHINFHILVQRFYTYNTQICT